MRASLVFPVSQGLVQPLASIEDLGGVFGEVLVVELVQELLYLGEGPADWALGYLQREFLVAGGGVGVIVGVAHEVAEVCDVPVYEVDSLLQFRALLLGFVGVVRDAITIIGVEALLLVAV